MHITYAHPTSAEQGEDSIKVLSAGVPHQADAAHVQLLRHRVRPGYLLLCTDCWSERPARKADIPESGYPGKRISRKALQVQTYRHATKQKADKHGSWPRANRTWTVCAHSAGCFVVGAW